MKALEAARTALSAVSAETPGGQDLALLNRRAHTPARESSPA
jgi:hypothetical protein